MNLWSDDDALWEAMTPALAADMRFARAVNDVDAIVRSVSLRPGARVLDVACGAGVHVVAFARRGYAVTGIDRTLSLLAIARARSPDVSLVCQDMRTLAFRPAFDLACCLYSSFGYFDEESNLRVLENIRNALRPGGTLVLDVIGRWEESAAMEIGGSHYAVRRRLSGSRLIEEWTVSPLSEPAERGPVRRVFRTEQRIYSAHELEDVLRVAGFARVEISCDDVSRLVAFAELDNV